MNIYTIILMEQLMHFFFLFVFIFVYYIVKLYSYKDFVQGNIHDTTANVHMNLLGINLPIKT